MTRRKLLNGPARMIQCLARRHPSPAHTRPHRGAFGVALRQGRPFTEQDTNATLPVVIVNETLARLAWPGQNPIGRQLRADGAEAPCPSHGWHTRWLERREFLTP